jgi:3-deoxy-D-manno-octulosonic-acid transferase
LGARNVIVTGNIKLFELPKVTKKVQKPSGVLVCGASTHEGEEALILDAFLDFKKEHIDAKLILVPRHPERFDTVAMMVSKRIKDTTLRTHRYQERKDCESDIIVLDMLGELVNIYAISDIVILGGAFEPIGGHNAAEAAQFGCKIISGKHYFNQKDIFDAIEGIAIVEASNLSRRLLQYGLLKPTQIKTKSDISLILESIKGTLPNKNIR